MQYKFTWIISTKNYQEIVCSATEEFDSLAKAEAFGYELLNSIVAKVIRTEDSCGYHWFT